MLKGDKVTSDKRGGITVEEEANNVSGRDRIKDEEVTAIRNGFSTSQASG